MSTPSKKRTGPTGLLKGLLEGLYEFTLAPAVDVAKRVESKALGRRDTALASTSSPLERLKAALDLATGTPLLAETAVDVGGDMASGLMSQGQRAADLFMGVERDKAGKLTGKVKESKPVQAVASAVPFLGPGIDEAVESGGNAEDVGRSLGQALAFYAGPKLAKKAPAAVRGLYESGKGETGAVKFGKVDKPLSASLGDSLRKALEDMVDPRESQAESALTKGFTRQSEPLSSAEFKKAVPVQKNMGPVESTPATPSSWDKSVAEAQKPKVFESFNQIKGDPKGLIEVPSSRELGGGTQYITVEKYNKLSFSELANLGFETPANVSKLKQGVQHTKNLENYKRQIEGMAEKLQAATDDPTGKASDLLVEAEVGATLGSALGEQLMPGQSWVLENKLRKYSEKHIKKNAAEAIRDSARAEKAAADAAVKAEKAAARPPNSRGGARAGAGRKPSIDLGKEIYDKSNSVLAALKERFAPELEWLKTGDQMPESSKTIKIALEARDEIARLERHRDARYKRGVNEDIKRINKLIEEKGVLEKSLIDAPKQGEKLDKRFERAFGQEAFETTPDGRKVIREVTEDPRPTNEGPAKDTFTDTGDPLTEGLAEEVWNQRYHPRYGMVPAQIKRFKGKRVDEPKMRKGTPVMDAEGNPVYKTRLPKTTTGLKYGSEKTPAVQAVQKMKAERAIWNDKMTEAVNAQDYELAGKVGTELTRLDDAIAKALPRQPETSLGVSRSGESVEFKKHPSPTVTASGTQSLERDTQLHRTLSASSRLDAGTTVFRKDQRSGANVSVHETEVPGSFFDRESQKWIKPEPSEGQRGLLGGLRDKIARNKQGDIEVVEGPAGERYKEAIPQYEGINPKTRTNYEDTFRGANRGPKGEILSVGLREAFAKLLSGKDIPTIANPNKMYLSLPDGRVVEYALDKQHNMRIVNIMTAEQAKGKVTKKFSPKDDEIKTISEQLSEDRGYGPNSYDLKEG